MKIHTYLYLQAQHLLWLAITITVVAAVLLSGLSPRANAAATAQLYLSPASQSITVGSNLVVSIMINTGGASINSVQSVITYPSATFSYVSTSPGSSFGVFPAPSVSAGSIQFTAGSTSSVSGTQTVAVVTLKSTATGSALLNLASVCATGNYALTCSAAYDSVTSSNDLASVSGGSYSINAASTQPSEGASSGTTTGGSAAKTPSSPKSSSSASSASPGSSPQPAVAPKISNLAISNITDNSAVVSWKTDIPATSMVQYGLNSNYGLVAKTDGLGTEHIVALPALDKGTTYYLVTESAAADGTSTTSPAERFSTPGFTILLTITDADGKPIEGAKVTVAGKTAITDKQGQVSFADVPSGQQEVAIKAGTSYTKKTVQVGDPLPDGQGYTKQEFTLVAEKTNNSMLVTSLGVMMLIVGVVLAFRLPLLKLVRSHFGSQNELSAGLEVTLPLYETSAVTSEATKKNPGGTIIQPNDTTHKEF